MQSTKYTESTAVVDNRGNGNWNSKFYYIQGTKTMMLTQRAQDTNFTSQNDI